MTALSYVLVAIAGLLWGSALTFVGQRWWMARRRKEDRQFETEWQLVLDEHRRRGW